MARRFTWVIYAVMSKRSPCTFSTLAVALLAACSAQDGTGAGPGSSVIPPPTTPFSPAGSASGGAPPGAGAMPPAVATPPLAGSLDATGGGSGGSGTIPSTPPPASSGGTGGSAASGGAGAGGEITADGESSTDSGDGGDASTGASSAGSGDGSDAFTGASSADSGDGSDASTGPSSAGSGDDGDASTGGDPSDGTTANGTDTPQPSACVPAWSSLGSGVSSTACVRLVDGEVACADLDNGSPAEFTKLTLNGATVTNATYAVGRGFHFAHCVSLAGAVYCGTGGSLYEPPVIEAGAGYLTGGYHSGCAVVTSDAGDEVHCFPENGSAEIVSLPGSDVVSLSGTYNYACAALADGTVHCWGEGGNSYLADKGATPTASVAVDFPGAVTVVGASQYSVCGGLAGGGLHCDGSSNQSSFPKSDDVTFDASYFAGASVTAIAPGQFGTCFLSDGAVHCSSTSETKRVPGLSDVKTIAGGRKWACAATSDDALVCWKKGQGGDSYETTTATLKGGEALQLQAAPCL